MKVLPKDDAKNAKTKTHDWIVLIEPIEGERNLKNKKMVVPEQQRAEEN